MDFYSSLSLSDGYTSDIGDAYFEVYASPDLTGNDYLNHIYEASTEKLLIGHSAWQVYTFDQPMTQVRLILKCWARTGDTVQGIANVSQFAIWHGI